MRRPSALRLGMHPRGGEVCACDCLLSASPHDTGQSILYFEQTAAQPRVRKTRGAAGVTFAAQVLDLVCPPCVDDWSTVLAAVAWA